MSSDGSDIGITCTVDGGLFWTPSQIRVRAYFEAGRADAERRGDANSVVYYDRKRTELVAEVTASQPEHPECADCRTYGSRYVCESCAPLPKPGIPRCQRHHFEHGRTVHGSDPMKASQT